MNTRPEPPYVMQHRALAAFDGIAVIGDRRIPVVLETSEAPDERFEVHTMVDGVEYRAGAEWSLAAQIGGLSYLEIAHAVSIEWDGVTRRGILTEVFRPPVADGNPWADTLQLRLTVDGESWDTGFEDTLTDALGELRRSTPGQWLLRCCFHCAFAGYDRLYCLSDRTFWCYRDVPGAIDGLRDRRHMTAAPSGGRYPVGAFHRCAAWRPIVGSASGDAL